MPEMNARDAAQAGTSRESLLLGGALVASLLVFALDFLTPTGIAHGTLYLPCILLAGLLRRRRGVLLVTALCMALLLAYVPLIDAGEPHVWRIAVANRLLSLLLLATTALATLRFLRLLEEREAALAESAQARRKLESEQMLRQIACQVGAIGGWSVDLQTMKVHLSDEAAAIQGQPSGFNPGVEEAIGLYAPEHDARLRAAFERCAHQGEPFDDEFEQVQGQRRVWVRASGRAVRDEHGTIVEVQGGLQDISAHKALEASVASGQRRFTQLADSLPLFVWSATPEGRIDYLSRQIVSHTGLSRTELLAGSEALQAMTHPDDWPDTRAAFKHSMATGEPFRKEFRVRYRDGEYHWHLSQAYPVFDESGLIERWVGSGMDIEERKRMEQHAQALSSRLTTTLESINEGFYLLDRDWRFTFFNRRAEELLGSPRETRLGRVLWEAYPPIVGTIFDIEYRRAMDSGEAVSFTTLYAPMGRWFEVHAFPSSEGLAVYFQDVTEQRAAEAQLRLLQAAVDQTNDIVLITEAAPLDEPGPRIVYANPAFERQMGYSADQAIGRTPRMLQGVDTSAVERARIRAALTKGRPVRALVANYTRSGQRVELELDIAPLHDAEGQLTHFVSVERNVTERVALEKRLQEAQRMESVGQLTGGLAHDFNNLLTVILGNAELMVEALPPQDRLHPVAEMMADAAGRAATLVQRLLAFARQQSLDAQPVDVASLVQGMDGLLRRTLGESVTLQVETEPGVPLALADPARLESALLNLCLNARDAMPGGGNLGVHLSKATVTAGKLEGLVPGEYVVLEVSDTGGGIAPQDLDRVFEPFFTTKERSGGSGLGLSMVYGYAKQSQGHVAIQSTVDVGTRVSLYLPVAAEGAVLQALPSTTALPRTSAGPARILVVEDNDLVRSFACSQLQGWGYEVLTAEHGAAALALLESGERVDLVFSDVVMPGGMSGLALAGQINARWPQLPILLTSGFAEDEQATLAEGPYPVLEKPYRPQALAARIGELLRPASR